MLLTIDIGNTNLTLGLYQGDILGARWRLATNYERMPDEYGLQILGLLQHSGCTIQQLDGVCLASVSPPITNRIVQACQVYLGQEPLLIDHRVKLASPFCRRSKAVGADRIVAPWLSKPVQCAGCVVDFGTATTFAPSTPKVSIWEEPLHRLGYLPMRFSRHRPGFRAWTSLPPPS